MSSFPAAARTVRDSSADPVDRFWALRECALLFPIYGFRATWHHVITHAGVPQTLSKDPLALTRAADELVEARQHFRQLQRTFETRRRAEKAEGRRQLSASDEWLTTDVLAYCPDPGHHPTDRLIAVLHRVIDANLWQTESRPVCAACGTARPDDTACAGCGVDPRGLRVRLQPEQNRLAEAHWRDIWASTAQKPRTRSVGGPGLG